MKLDELLHGTESKKAKKIAKVVKKKKKKQQKLRKKEKGKEIEAGPACTGMEEEEDDDDDNDDEDDDDHDVKEGDIEKETDEERQEVTHEKTLGENGKRDQSGDVGAKERNRKDSQ
jgi:hypothetical protein